MYKSTLNNDGISKHILDSLQKISDSIHLNAHKVQDNFAKSHEMDFYLKSFLESLRNLNIKAGDEILKNPLYSMEFLEIFSNKVSIYVPMSQALEIITIFSSELSNYLSSNLYFAKDAQTKKRKILVDTFKTSTNALYKESFQKACEAFFTDYINPIILSTTTDLLTNNNDNNSKVDKSTYSKLVWTALNLHHTFVDISDLYWKNTSSNNKHQFITNLQKLTMLEDPKLILFMNKVCLQHVHQTLLSSLTENNDEDEEDKSTNINSSIQDILKSVVSTLSLPTITSSPLSWNGSLVDLTVETFPIANFMIIIRDWLDVVINNCQYESVELLRSAEFYELVPLREISSSNLVEKNEIFYEKLVETTSQILSITVKYLILKSNQESSLKHIKKLVEFLKSWSSNVIIMGDNTMKNNSSGTTIWKIITGILKIQLENIEIFNEVETLNCFYSLANHVSSKLAQIITHYLKNIFDGKLDDNTKKDLKSQEKLIIKNFTSLDYEFKAYSIALQTLNMSKNHGFRIEDQVISLVRLSKELFVVTKQLIQFSTSINNNHSIIINYEILNNCVLMTSILMEFISNFEMLQNNLIIDFWIWDLMSILYNEDSQSDILNEMNIMYGKYISKLSEVQYGKLVNAIMIKVEDLPPTHSSSSSLSFQEYNNNRKLKFFLHLIDLLLKNSKHAQLRQLERKLPNLLFTVYYLEESCENLKARILILKIYSFIVSHKAFTFQSNDIGIILSSIISITSPKPIVTTHATDEQQQEDYENLFKSICYLLHNILAYRREILICALPSFIQILQDMFHGFKSKGKNINSHSFSYNKKLQQQTNLKNFWDINLSTSLSIECGNSFARLLEMVKHKNFFNKYRNNNNKNNKESASKFSQAFGKYVPTLISKYIKIQIEEGYLDQSTREALKAGIYSLLDLFGDYERNMLMANLDKIGKILFKNLWTDYIKNWKYVGRG
ncbi:4774_t:CDS:10 [Entrophospora sp. SA101]|nr:3780_t:CDS:10 [Entrophospora sp. SA101]CAJ0751044.1 4774_t:CDS:10 [Entrophospora sp. SA101]